MNKADKKELTNAIVSKLEKHYNDNGFKWMKTGATRFEKNDQFVFWGAGQEFSTSLVFRPWFRVVNEEILTIIQEIFPSYIGAPLASMTIVRVQSPELIEEMNFEDYASNYIHKSAHGVSYFYSVEKDTPLEPIVEDHINFMNKVGLPFFEKVDSLEGINDFLNGRILKGDMDYFQSEERVKELQPFFSQREVLSGVTCAYLIKNLKIEELLNRYRIFFEGNNYVLEPMEKVVEYFNKKIN
jgi:hypothetical protein